MMDIDGTTFSSKNSDLSLYVNNEFFNGLIAAEDNMLKRDNLTYYWVGITAIESVNAIINHNLADRNEVKKILDFPSGYGRVTRFLRSEFPKSEITACDIDKNAVDFCAKQFNAIPLYSSVNVSDVSINNKFDLIWVGSLFTHLDRNSWETLLLYLSNHLAIGGLLIFTVAGRFVFDLFMGENTAA